MNPEAVDLTHQFSPCGGSTENPESGTCIRSCPAPEACNPLQSNGMDMESAALQNPARTRHSPQTSQQKYVFTQLPFLSRHLPQSGCQTQILVRQVKKSGVLRKYEEWTVVSDLAAIRPGNFGYRDVYEVANQCPTSLTPGAQSYHRREGGITSWQSGLNSKRHLRL